MSEWTKLAEPIPAYDTRYLSDDHEYPWTKSRPEGDAWLALRVLGGIGHRDTIRIVVVGDWMELASDEGCSCCSCPRDETILAWRWLTCD